MSEVYLQIAEQFEKIAAGYRTLAGTGDPKKSVAKKEHQPEQNISVEDVRAVLAAKSQAGKTKDVKALLMKYDAGKLSAVKPEDYEALLKEAERL